ncbi:MAG: exo-alpha-sialidase [Corynebacteriales bacterium]|nr:exo-alpha-sialidase [Mycobacteriales bacterium]
MSFASEQDESPSTSRSVLAITFAAAIAIITAIATTAWAPPSPGREESKPVQAAGINEKAPIAAFPTVNQGYALAAPCTGEGCHYRLWTTATGGESWRGFSTPLLVEASRPQLGTFGTSGVLLANQDDRWISNDRGRIWRKLPSEPLATRAALPMGSLTITRCVDNTCHVDAIEPDGTLVTLETEPGLADVDSAGWQRLTRSSLILSGVDQHGNAMVVTSPDAGQSWRAMEMTPQVGEPRSMRASGNAEGTMLLWARSVDNTITSYRSDDNGGSWNALATVPAQPVSFVILSSGRALVLDGAILFASDPGSSTLSELPDAPALRNLRDTGEMLVGTGLAGEVYLSIDGTNWRHLDLSSLS